MEGLLGKIEEGFAEVCNSDDPIAAYGNYHRVVAEASDNINDKFLEEAGAELLTRRGTSLSPVVNYDNTRTAIEATRKHEFVDEGGATKPYFYGSGIIVVGDARGELVCVDYSKGPDGIDPLAEYYGDYMSVAFRKAGQAALLRRLGGGQEELEQILVGLELKSAEELPHHHGYQFWGSSPYVAGASGMLPSVELAKLIKRDFLEEAKLAAGLGYLGPAGMLDFFAGLHDEEAAERLIRNLEWIRKEFEYVPPVKQRKYSDLASEFYDRTQRGHNVH